MCNLGNRTGFYVLDLDAHQISTSELQYHNFFLRSVSSDFHTFFNLPVPHNHKDNNGTMADETPKKGGRTTITPDDKVKFLISCINHSNEGKVISA
jgi:hypothetical protein